MGSCGNFENKKDSDWSSWWSNAELHFLSFLTCFTRITYIIINLGMLMFLLWQYQPTITNTPSNRKKHMTTMTKIIRHCCLLHVSMCVCGWMCVFSQQLLLIRVVLGWNVRCLSPTVLVLASSYWNLGQGWEVVFRVFSCSLVMAKHWLNQTLTLF